ncbi:hypothetical protein F2P56_026083 [Juglans regia]|uniref:Uncharacterized protein n=1 Tax=Juglans regia TaxID=51240 RepID=A0A833U408_JUGRE|nr:hypothetical protein F2P56_026083 [Juglans regia]
MCWAFWKELKEGSKGLGIGVSAHGDLGKSKIECGIQLFFDGIVVISSSKVRYKGKTLDFQKKKERLFFFRQTLTYTIAETLSACSPRIPVFCSIKASRHPHGLPSPAFIISLSCVCVCEKEREREREI